MLELIYFWKYTTILPRALHYLYMTHGSEKSKVVISISGWLDRLNDLTFCSSHSISWMTWLFEMTWFNLVNLAKNLTFCAAGGKNTKMTWMTWLFAPQAKTNWRFARIFDFLQIGWLDFSSSHFKILIDLQRSSNITTLFWIIPLFIFMYSKDFKMIRNYV